MLTTSSLSFHAVVLLALQVVAAVGGAVGFVQCLLTRPDAFVAASKLTKSGWSVILGVSTLVVLALGVLGLLGLAAGGAIIVYWVDVRPAIQRVLGRGGSDGPYGRW